LFASAIHVLAQTDIALMQGRLELELELERSRRRAPPGCAPSSGTGPGGISAMRSNPDISG
jgi:hypothetical protein